MQHRMRDCIDEPSHADARKLEKVFQKLEDDVQVKKNPYTIRDDLKQIENICQSMDEAVMSHGDVTEIESWIRSSLQKIR